MQKLALPITNLENIKSLIPQREPMIMVDGVLEFTKKTLKGTLTIHQDNFFNTHNSLSEFGLIEHMAQCAALHRGYAGHLERETPQVGYIGAIKKLVIDALPAIGKQLITTVEIVNEVLNITLVKAECFCDDKKIASCMMTTALQSEND